MAENLYKLLRSSGRIPPECQLNSKVVEWAGERRMGDGNNIDMYKGRYLNSQDVRIKVIRSINMRDENNVKVRLTGVGIFHRDSHTFRGLGVKSKCGRKYMKWTRETISYHSTVSTLLMVFVCESRQCHAVPIVITSSHQGSG